MGDYSEEGRTDPWAERWARWKADAIDTGRFAVILFTGVFILRTFLGQPFHIPSASMEPSLQVGDFVIVSKFPYGYSNHSFPFSLGPWTEARTSERLPERGAVVVFRLDCRESPYGGDCRPVSEAESRAIRAAKRDGSLDVDIDLSRRDYIKRVVGLPGDEIEVRQGRLIINGERLPLSPVTLPDDITNTRSAVNSVAYEEILPNGVKHLIYDTIANSSYDDFGPVTVPEGHVFMMGDHRDNSTDSRAFGPVPAVRLVGPAHFMLFSIEPPLWRFWRWPFAARFDRFFRPVE